MGDLGAILGARAGRCSHAGPPARRVGRCSHAGPPARRVGLVGLCSPDGQIKTPEESTKFLTLRVFPPAHPATMPARVALIGEVGKGGGRREEEE